MRSSSPLVRLLASRALSLRARLGLLLARGRRSVRPARAYAARYGKETIFLSQADFDIDLRSLAFVVVDGAYATDYTDTVVLDVGAHKGYYGAYAATRGARAVIAYEPEEANVELLARTASAGRGGAHWQVRAAAVDEAAGEAELHVMHASWGHALAPPERFAEYEVGVVAVPVVALADALIDAVELASGSRVVVKINIEGAECSAILGTPTYAWAGVDELFVETHPWATCDATDLAGHLERAGLTPVESAHPAVLRMRREGHPRSDRRTETT